LTVSERRSTISSKKRNVPDPIQTVKFQRTAGTIAAFFFHSIMGSAGLQDWFRCWNISEQFTRNENRYKDPDHQYYPRTDPLHQRGWPAHHHPAFHGRCRPVLYTYLRARGRAAGLMKFFSQGHHGYHSLYITGKTQCCHSNYRG
jgi:hypothetical protein